MGFKLVRVDAIEPRKVPLSLGSHFIGRGKFLDCHDHRVSRKHAELIVSTDSVIIKSLHRNPCFYKKKSSDETITFSQPDLQVLTNGDQFGLIPDTFWYEIIYCPDASTADIPERVGDEQDVCVERDILATMNEDSFTEPFDQENQEKLDGSNDSNAGEESQSLLPPNSPLITNVTGNDLMMPNPVNIEQPARSPNQLAKPQNQSDQSIGLPQKSVDQSDESEDQPEKSVDQSDESEDQPEKSADQSDESNNQPDEPIDQEDKPSDQFDESPNKATYKRTHSHDSSPCDVKKVKIEPVESTGKENEESKLPQPVKTEPESPQGPVPGPSNDQAGSSTNGQNNGPPKPQSPTKPPNNLLRERCMYGANCYRRNPQHKARFSHPQDSDWGPGERAPCPWGAACRRADPRHWRDHHHPPGVLPPAAPGQRQGKRKRRQRSETPDSSSGEDISSTNLIVTGKRARKPVARQGWSDSEGDDDPYKTDDEDEWEPPSDVTSQDYSQSQDL